MKTLRKEHKALVHFAAKDDSRPILTGVYLDPETGLAVAADGGKLLVMPMADLNPADYPTTPGALQEPIKACVVPAATIAASIKTLPAKPLIPSLAHVKLTSDGKGKVTLTTYDLAVYQDRQVEPIRGTYPKYDPLIPAYAKRQNPGVATFGLARKHLAALVKAMSDMDVEYVRFQISSYNAPIRVDFSNGDNPATDAWGILMPAVIEDKPNKEAQE